MYGNVQSTQPYRGSSRTIPNTCARAEFSPVAPLLRKGPGRVFQLLSIPHHRLLSVDPAKCLQRH